MGAINTSSNGHSSSSLGFVGNPVSFEIGTFGTK